MLRAKRENSANVNTQTTNYWRQNVRHWLDTQLWLEQVKILQTGQPVYGFLLYHLMTKMLKIYLLGSDQEIESQSDLMKKISQLNQKMNSIDYKLQQHITIQEEASERQGKQLQSEIKGHYWQRRDN